MAALADGLSPEERDQFRLEAEQARQVEAQTETAVAQSITGLLVLLATTVYVALTYGLVREARTSRLAVAEAARREKSEAAALRALSAIRQSNIRSGRGEPETVKSESLRLHLGLEAEVPFIGSDEVAERVDACQEAARVFAWPVDQFRGYNHALASIRIREIVTITRYTLESYVGGRPLPDWHDLPHRTGAMNWLFGPPED